MIQGAFEAHRQSAWYIGERVGDFKHERRVWSIPSELHCHAIVIIADQRHADGSRVGVVAEASDLDVASDFLT